MNPTALDIAIRTPCVLPAGCSVADVRAHLTRDHVHLALLVDPAGRLVTTVTRDDIDGVAADRPAAGHGRIEDRVVPPEMTEPEVRERLARLGVRRAAVVGEDGRLLGLVCAKRSGQGYCTDDGIAERRLSRSSGEPG